MVENANTRLISDCVQAMMAANNAYDRLKDMTRGKPISATLLHEFIATLAIPEDDKARLLALTPSTYTGLAESLTRQYPF